MFKVECPDCKAPYQVDERRVPSTGLKMRCPKCGNSFQVDPPPDPRATGPSPLLAGGAPSAPGKPGLPPIRKQTMLGVAGPGGAAAPPRPAPKHTLLGTAPPGASATAGAPKPPPRPGLTKPLAPVAEPAPAADAEFADFGDIGLDLPGPAAAKPAPPKAAPPRPLPQPTEPEAIEVDLPAPVAPRPAAPMAGFGEIDLPSPVAAGGAAAVAAAFAADAEELDLPVVGGPRGAVAGGGGADLLDLPSPASSGGGFGNVDLPLPAAGLPAARTGAFGELDLPALGSDLPSIAGDLPSIQAGLPLPAAGLPAIAAGLPQPAAGLPMSAAGLPQPAAGLPMNAAGLPMGAAGLPMNAAGMPMNAAGLPVHGGTLPMGAGPSAFGELDLGQGPGVAAGPSWGAPPPSADAAGIVRQSGGGTSFGEVNLEGGAGGASIDAARDEMEFRGLPQEGQAAAEGAPLQVRAPAPRIATEDELAPPPKKKSLRAIAAVAVVLVLAGGALALVPNVGPFGVLWAYDRVMSGEYQKVMADTSKTVRDALAKDTHPEAKKAYLAADSARSKNKRQKSLAAYAVYVAYGRELRFGADSEVSARASVLLQELKPENVKEVPNLDLARAAHAAATGGAAARSLLETMAAARPNDIDVLALLGEVQLRARDPEAAAAAWEKAEAVEKSARTAYGLARARFIAGDRKRAEELANLTLTRNPSHVGARILTARATWNFGKEAAASKLLEEVTKDTASSSSGELVEAYTLLGEVHLARSRVTHAEKAFSEALKIDPKSARSLVGLGDALYRSGRYSEALARFEAATQADPQEITARVGIAKTALALERLQDATSAIGKLRTEFPKSVLVVYWHCRVLEASGSRKEAEEAYRQVIKAGVADPDLVLIHIGLAQLLTAQGKHDEARAVLADARKALPDSALVRSSMGDIALGQGKTADAVREYQAALEVDPGDVGAKFKLAIAHRRDKNFELAGKTFDQVAEVDKEYPGLALERGLLFEASGRGAEALKAYEDALAKAPNDPDLMLRVGCGKAGSPQAAKQAAEMLGKVLEKRPSSAEAHHCKGKALLTDGSNLAESLRTLEKAVDLDPNRAEFHLYVAWAANEVGRPQRAEIAVQKALELDQRLGDAYWQRGVLRFKQGAVRDAVKDLQKALELKPDRVEAHAALGDSLYDLGKEAEALTHYQTAVEGQPDNATWRFRYGKVLAANSRGGEAEAQLTRALELAAKADTKPRWEWEAHHLLARSMGERKEAIPHWETFLRLAPADNPYRAEAKKTLAALGKPWGEN